MEPPKEDLDDGLRLSTFGVIYTDRGFVPIRLDTEGLSYVIKEIGSPVGGYIEHAFAVAADQMHAYMLDVSQFRFGKGGGNA